MNVEIHQDATFHDIEVVVDENKPMQKVIDKMHELEKEEYDKCAYLNELMAFYHDGCITVAITLVEFARMERDDIIIDNENVYMMKELPYGMTKPVIDYFEGRFEDPVYW